MKFKLEFTDLLCGADYETLYHIRVNAVEYLREQTEKLLTAKSKNTRNNVTRVLADLKIIDRLMELTAES